MSDLPHHTEPPSYAGPSEVEPRDPLWLRLLTIGVLAVIAIALLAASRGAWLDPIIDSGRDLYFPREILEGRKLYRDFVYFYPPGAPYALAALTALIGSSLTSYAAIGLVMAAATLALIAAISYRAGGFRAASASSLLFITCSMTGASTWGANFVFPFAHAATLGTVAILGFLFSLVCHIAHPRRRLLVIAGSFGTAATFLKLDFALVVVGCTLVVILWNRVSPLFAGGIAALHVGVAAAIELYFRDSASYSHWLFDNALAASRVSGPMSQFFYSQVFGSASVGRSLREIAISATAICVALVLAVAAGRSRRRSTLVSALVVVAISAIALFLAGPRFFRGWVVLLLLLVPLALKDGRRSPFVLLIAAAYLSSARILLNLSPDWYGFYLAVPLYVVIGSVLFGLLPSRAVLTRTSALLLVPLLIVSSIWYGRQQSDRYALKQFEIVSARGTIFDHNHDRARILNAFFQHLRDVDAGEMVVFPEGITLNYLSRTRSPVRFHTFTPIETATTQVEDRILSALQAEPPERIVIVSRDVSEFGFRGFGVDYNQSISGWIQAEYVVERAWRAEGFSLLLLNRR